MPDPYPRDDTYRRVQAERIRRNVPDPEDYAHPDSDVRSEP